MTEPTKQKPLIVATNITHTTMKQIMYSLIVIVLLCIGCTTPKGSVSKKDVPKYVPFKEFKGDTAAYLLQSLENRKQYYIGRKFKVLLDDIELPVQFCFLSENYLKVKGKVVYGQGEFYFCKKEVYDHPDDKNENAYYIYVMFAPPYADYNVIGDMMRSHDGNWWNEESLKILKQLIVTDFQYCNRSIPLRIGK